jgi:hypothetical protein
MNNINNIISTNNTNSNKNYKPNNSFNKKVSDCILKCNLFPEEGKIDSRAIYHDEESYQNSFDDIIDFSKSTTEKDKNSINCIIFNIKNEDGIYGAYTAWAYLNDIFPKTKTKSKKNETKELNANKMKDVTFIPTGPHNKSNEVDFRIRKAVNLFKDRVVLIVDLSYGKRTLEFITEHASKLIIIDDHPRKNKNIEELDNTIAFIGDDKHCASAYVWKFFYPKLDVPLYIQRVDNNDRKLFLPYLFYSNEFRTYVNFRIFHNPYLPKFDKNSSFIKMYKLLSEVENNYTYLVGKYYFEVQNNIKDQVAKNAVKKTFQGHPVYVLNYNDPVMYKMVGRQMITNAEKRGDHIDFVVLWGWEYTSNAYKIFLSEKHQGVAKFNLPDMAQKLAKIGGVPKGGKGSRYIGNFYWPRNSKYDIWDLFEQKYI